MLDKILGVRATTAQAPAVSWFLPVRGTAGVDLTEDTALQLSAVFAATKAISETIAMLPWRVYREQGERRILRNESQLDRVLHRAPNEEMTAFTFREYLVACALLHGNGYAEIQRTNTGNVVALHPIHPSFVTPDRNDAGKLVYKVQDDQGSAPSFISARQMFHLRGPTKDGIVGRSVISLARDSMGIGIASDQFAGSFLGNGATPSLVIQQGESAPDLSKEGASNMLESFDRRHKGAKNAGKSAYLERGFEAKQVGIPQKDAQFIEQRRFTVVEIARWFRVPPHKIQSMEAASFSNIEQQAIEFVTDSIQPWAQRLEHEADSKLTQKGDITKININGIMRGDSAARSQFYTSMFNMGAYSTNDIRRLEDDDPVEGGNQRFVPLNMTPLNQAANSVNGAAAIRGVLVDAHTRMLEKERMAAERAHAKGKDMSEWAQEFYSRHEQQLREALHPGAEALANLYSVGDVDATVHAHARQHVETSMTDAVSEAWGNWPERAAPAADQLIERIVGAQP